MSLLRADARHLPLADRTVQCVVTSPPYWGLRDYGTAGQIGLEQTPAAYVAELVAVFREVRRVLRDDGVLWLNLGDSYANDTKWGGSSGGKHVKALHGQTGIGRQKVQTGLKSKDLVGIPWRVAFALQADGWYLRSDIIWHKPNPMPESVTDRPTKAHEYVFLLTKAECYYYDAKAIQEASIYPDDNPKARARADDYRDRAVADRISAINPLNARAYPTRNARTVWTIATQPYSGAHFATMPEALAERCILASTKAGDRVLDPFGGSGTTARVALSLGRRAVSTELNPSYLALAEQRTHVTLGLPLEVA
jgi:DNA modification methylase